MAHATTGNIGTRRIRQGGLLVAAAGLGVTALGIPAAIAQVPENLLCAFVFDDVNANGVIDEGEQPIPNVWINLRLGIAPWTVLEGEATDGDGEVCFEVDPEGGPYKLEELDPEGYESTTPNSFYPIVPGEQQIWDFGDRLPVDPTDPTVPTTDPSVPPPTDPSVPPPTEPSVPATDPSVPPPTEPSVPPTAATVPTTVTEPLSVTTQVPTTVATTVATTAATTAATTSTTAAPTTTVLSTLTATPTAAPASVAVLAGTLPRTGGDPGLALAGMGMIVIGGLMTAVRRKPS